MEIYFEMFFCFDLLYISFNEDKQIVGQLYGVGNLVSARFSGRPAQVDNIMGDVCVCVCVPLLLLARYLHHCTSAMCDSTAISGSGKITRARAFSPIWCCMPMRITEKDNRFFCSNPTVLLHIQE